MSDDLKQDDITGQATRSARRPEKIFGALRDRPVDEIDSAALWRRIEADLQPHAAGWLQRLARAVGLGATVPATQRLVAVGAAALIVFLAGLGLVRWLPAAGPAAPVDPELLRAPEAAAALTAGDETGPGAAAADRGWMLDVRLVRGYDGAPPDDAIVDGGVGAGGADRLADLRPALGGLLPFDGLALVGQWQGVVAPHDGATDARLSDAFELSFEVAPGASGVNLSEVLLAGAGRPLVADSMALVPGRPLLFGVQAEGERSDAGSLVLAVRLLPAAGELPAADSSDAGAPASPGDTLSRSR